MSQGAGPLAEERSRQAVARGKLASPPSVAHSPVWPELGRTFSRVVALSAGNRIALETLGTAGFPCQ